MAGTKRSLPPASFNGNKRAKTVPSNNSKAGKFASKQKTKPVRPPSPESTDFSNDGDSFDEEEAEAFDGPDEDEVEGPLKKVRVTKSSTNEGTDSLGGTKHSDTVNGEGYLKRMPLSCV